MSVIQVLMDEHRVIRQVLACLQKIAEECERNGKLDAQAARDAIGFFRTFADRCHHGKEEDLLFPVLEGRGFSPDEGPTAVMRSEHVQGRGLIAAMEQAVDGASRGDAGRVAAFVEHAREYADMLDLHIRKEDECLFPLAEKALDPASIDELERGFRKVEQQDIGPKVYRESVQVADRLAERYGVRKAATTGQGAPR